MPARPAERARLAALSAAIVLLGGCSALQDPTNAEMPTAKAPPEETEQAPAAPPPDHCFGDSPPEVIAHDARPFDIFATGNEVVWRSRAPAQGAAAGDLVLHRWDAATGTISTLTPPRSMFVFVAADAHGILGLDNHTNPGAPPDLACIDLPSGSVRVVAHGADLDALVSAGKPGIVAVIGTGTPLFHAGYAVDADYVYIAWGDANVGQTLGANPGPGHLARVKRDGSSAPESLGAGPGGPFVLADGYAYWGVQGTGGLERRAITPGATIQLLWAPPRFAAPWAVGVSEGRLYFKRGDPIESVPAVPASIGGGSPTPRAHTGPVRMGRPPDGQAVFDGRCVYAVSVGNTGEVVSRVDVHTGKADTLLAKRTPREGTYAHVRYLAMDAHALYLADYYGDRIVRWR